MTSGELTEEMIKNYLEHHFEPKGDDNFMTLVHYTKPPALAGGCLVPNAIAENQGNGA